MSNDIKAGDSCGYGFVFDAEHGVIRHWYKKKGDVRRWIDNYAPVDDVSTQRQDLLPNEQESIV